VRYWVSGIGAVFVVSLGALVSNAKDVMHFSNSAKVLTLVGIIILILNLLALATAIAFQEVVNHGLRFVAMNPSKLSDDEIIWRNRVSDRIGRFATAAIVLSALFSVIFLVMCVIGVVWLLWR
jgi:hypothetical protein